MLVNLADNARIDDESNMPCGFPLAAWNQFTAH